MDSGLGKLRLIGDALEAEPSISSGIRLVSIGTNVKAKESGGDGHEINWNGAGRQVIFSQFPKLWWLEIDWTYNGMFHGPEAIQLKQDLAACGGELGQHIADVISSVPWADNFRAGDTPSVLYLIDPDNNKDDPSEISWAGRFIQPFPKTRPNYWTGITGGVTWNFSTPSESWHNASSVYQARSQTLRVQRPEMYESLLNRVQFLYGTLGYQRSDRPDNSAIFHPSAQLILEAENARYRGTLSRKDKSPSNETFIYLDNKCWVAWRFQFDDKPAKFSMSLRYRTKKREPHKLTLFVNGANLGEREFPTDSREWETLDFEAFLETGPNSVVLRHESGTLEIDRLRIGK